MKGIIIKGIGGFYYVKTADGSVTECRARGIFRKNGIKPTVGDNVEIENASVVKIYDRRSYLVRPSVANIDNLIIVIAAANPAPDLLLTDKLTVAAEVSGITPVICINKTDLANSEEIEKIYTLAGYKVITAAATELIGAKALEEVVKGKISAFAGLSGVGKSSILNLLSNENAQTGEVSRINRGKHTTRHVELFEIDKDTFILDTPGFSSLALSDICDVKASELSGYYPEFASYANDCRFKGCSHINEPDCAVKALVSDGQAATSRYESYKVLYEQLKQIKEWEKD
ncbi:MAG: ribosome small subunit-dependent GTPase A [Clostridia bacterium]|nr:ribosome small subunit-dependent GTPase A [Clostridia bacterium]